MLKRIMTFLSFVCILSLCGCSLYKKEEAKPIEEIKGIWISYIEIEKFAESEKGFSEEFESAIEKIKNLGLNSVFVHIRANADSIYPTELFPLMKAAENYKGDMLSDIIDICHKNGIKFHAWINPYRISNGKESKDKTEKLNLSQNDYLYWQDGVYLNPSSEKAQKLIIDGIKEVIRNYPVDGIHFDDYFYPTNEVSFDENSYNRYKDGKENMLSLDDYRRANVNSLISGVYSAIKFKNKDICFSISPCADIQKNRSVLYADIEYFCKTHIVDVIIPQIYFGFEYPDERYSFEHLLSEWIALTIPYKTPLVIGLSPYKLNTEAEPDSAEWQGGTDIISNQIENIKNYECVSGFSLFSYSSVFDERESFAEQRKKIEEKCQTY